MIEKYTAENYNVARNPYLYYKFVDIVRSVTEDQVKELNNVRSQLEQEIEGLSKKEAILQEASNNFMEETQASYRANQNKYSSLEQANNMFQDFKKEHFNFIVLLAEIIKGVNKLYKDVYELSQSLTPPVVMTLESRPDKLDSYEKFQGVLQEIQLNGHVLEGFFKSLHGAHQNYDVASHTGRQIAQLLEQYYKILLHRHSVEGVKIFIDPVITDVALRVFENIDSHGEIESGKKKDQISAYTVRKAEVLTKALKDDMVRGFLEDPNSLHSFLRDSLTQIEKFVSQINLVFQPQAKDFFQQLGNVGIQSNNTLVRNSTLKNTLTLIKNVGPTNVTYSESKVIKSESELLIEKVTAESVEQIAYKILDPKVNFEDIVKYVLERKVELRKFFHEENSFYVCKIGEGNPFMGQAPGALYVVPAERPRGTLDGIVGSGFAEVKEFVQSIEASAKWHDLFLATSPSQSTDKSNILLVGPQGCGKTEIMRAVGSDKNSIGVFAQGSDFNTCWRGEAEKNPKRMFEEGIKLNRESGKHVHFLIDEIDAVLNNDREMGGYNLTLEFQILMDGVVSYPNLSIWGATNNPERIPVPMIRRFNKVLVVGELDQDNRIFLLKQFLDYLPLEEISKDHWSSWATTLEGATGDVIRKVADHLWRTEMNRFVQTDPTNAEMVIKHLNSKGSFSIDKFDRNEFKKILGEYIKISINDINTSIETNLANMAIQTEIKTAVNTYQRAKEFLKQVNKQKPALN